MSEAEALRRIANAAISLNNARRALQQGRPGAANPHAVLMSLAKAQLEAAIAWDLAVTAYRIPFQFFLELCKEQLRGASQYLEYTQYMPNLPDPVQGRRLDEAQSSHFRSNISSQAVGNWKLLEAQLEVNEITLDTAEHIELKIAALSCQFHVRHIEPDVNLWRAIEDTLSDVEEHLAAGTEDAHEFLPWARISLLRMLLPRDVSRYGRDILNTVPDFADRDVAWQLILVQLQLGADLGLPEAAISAFEALVPEILTRQISDRRGMVVLALAPVQYCAGTLADRGDLSGAKRILYALTALGGQALPVGEILTTFIFGSNIYAIFDSHSPAVLFKAELDKETFSAFLQASEDARPKNASLLRKNLSRQLSVIAKDSRLTSTTSLTLNPLGVTAWIPWHGLTSHDGSPFAQTSSLQWIHPLARTSSDGSASFLSGRLVIDRSIPGSAEIIQAWSEATGFRADAVFAYDSVKGSHNANTVLDAIAESPICIFFGHATSDVFQPEHRGLVVGPNIILTTDQIRSASMHAVDYLLLIACESGRSHPFEPASSPAHAFAASGVKTVTATLWSILIEDGKRYFMRVLTRAKTDPREHPLETWRSLIRRVDQVSLPFYCTTRT
jgi:hypothetical protein